jgi:hypothetical protein
MPSEEELNEMAEKVLAGGDPIDLIMGLIFCVDLRVGRYLGNFNLLEYADDMVSEGMAAVMKLCRNIPIDTFKDNGILKVAGDRVEAAIEEYLNGARAVTAPSAATQRLLIGRDEDPIYYTAEYSHYDDDYVEHPCDPGDEKVRDALEIISKLKPNDALDEAIMHSLSWGQTCEELAEEWGVSKMTISRRREALYKQYLELERGER